MTSARMRVAPGCAVTVDGRAYEAGTEFDPALLGRLLEPVPELQLRLEVLSAHEFVEFSAGEHGQVCVRPVSASCYATRARAASVQVGPYGDISKRLAAQPATDGSAELERRLALPDDTDGRVRVNPYFKGTQS